MIERKIDIKMHRLLAFVGAGWLLAAVAAGACGKASGRPDAGAGGNSIAGAAGGTGDGGSGGIAGGGGTGGTGSGGTTGGGGTGSLVGTGGTQNGDAGERLDGDDGDSDAGGVIEDAADAARDGGTQTPECLAKNGTEYRVFLNGTGFDAYEGRTLIALTTDSRLNPCRAIGTTQIRDGAFQIELVNLAVALYPNVDAFIDLDDNGRCSDDVDAKWHITGVLTTPRSWTSNLTPTNFSVPGICVVSASF